MSVTGPNNLMPKKLLRDGNLVEFWKVLNRDKYQGNKNVLGNKNY